MKLCRAKIPEKWLMETFPFDRHPKLNKKKVTHLYDAFDYMTQQRNIIFFGPTGTGNYRKFLFMERNKHTYSF
jgi:DNA replication protein DnaC